MGGFAEVLLEEHAPPRVVLVDGASERARATRAPDAAGGATLRASARDAPNAGRRRLLTWAITADDGAAIHLAETPTGGVGAPPRAPCASSSPTSSSEMACVVEPAAADHRAPAAKVAIDGGVMRGVARPATDIRPTGRHLPLLHRRHPRGRRGRLRRARAPRGTHRGAAVGTASSPSAARAGVALLDAARRSRSSPNSNRPPSRGFGTPSRVRAEARARFADSPWCLARRATRPCCSRRFAPIAISKSSTSRRRRGPSPRWASRSRPPPRSSAASINPGVMEAACARAPPPPCTSRRDFSPSRRATRPRSGASEDASDERASSSPRARPPCRCTRSIAGWARRRARRRPSRFARRCAEARETWSRFAFATAPCGRSAPTARFAGGRWTRSIARDPCTTLGDAARELGKWEHGREGVEGARGAVAALLSRGGGDGGGVDARSARARGPRRAI